MASESDGAQRASLEKETMRNRDIGLRAQDVQAGLQDVSVSGPAAGLFDRTLLAGMTARLAIHIRGVEVIDDAARLYAVAERLGINSLLLPRVLSTMEEAEFVSVQYSSDRPKLVQERVPIFGDIYDRVGEIWESQSPREEEIATLELLQRLADSPKALQDIRRETALDENQLQIVLDVGRNGAYLAQFELEPSRVPVIYSPLYWEENPDATFELIRKWGGARIAQAIRTVRAHQGLPLVDASRGSTEDDQVILEAMAAGLLPSPEVTSARGPKRFAFTPYQGQIALQAHEKAILQKARAILACVRYGEHFGTVTRIQNPAAIVSTLISNGRIGPHSEIAQQYAILVVEGIARISPDATFRSRYHLHVIDSPENTKALKLAAELIAVGEAISDRGLDDQARGVLFGTGSIRDAETTRSAVIRNSRAAAFDGGLIARELSKLIDHAREPL